MDLEREEKMRLRSEGRVGKIGRGSWEGGEDGRGGVQVGDDERGN